MEAFLTLATVDDVLAFVHGLQPLPPEQVLLENALGRVLAEDLAATEDLPGFTRSTMDGFAVEASSVFGASEGTPALLDYRGECQMGEEPSLVIEKGETARVWTGGMLPQGANAVVMLEYSRNAGKNQVELTRPVAPGDNVILFNEDAQKGTVLLKKGTILRAQELGLLAGLGVTHFKVTQRPRVAIISSGDEVIPVSEQPRIGQVRDVNTYTLMALAASCGAEARSFGIVHDNEESVCAKVQEALAYGNVVLVSGGSSAGQRDFTIKAFMRVNGCSIFAHGVAISPGKPMIVAQKGNQTLWGMPGHAASALVCAEVFIKPLLRHLAGMVERTPITTYAQLTRPVSSTQGRRDYIRVAVLPPVSEGNPLRAQPVLGKSGLITTLVQADALVVCPESQEGLYAGQLVELFPLR